MKTTKSDKESSFDGKWECQISGGPVHCVLKGWQKGLRIPYPFLHSKDRTLTTSRRSEMDTEKFESLVQQLNVENALLRREISLVRTFAKKHFSSQEIPPFAQLDADDRLLTESRNNKGNTSKKCRVPSIFYKSAGALSVTSSRSSRNGKTTSTPYSATARKALCRKG